MASIFFMECLAFAAVYAPLHGVCQLRGEQYQWLILELKDGLNDFVYYLGNVSEKWAKF
jgi:hypothetical protein